MFIQIKLENLLRSFKLLRIMAVLVLFSGQYIHAQTYQGTVNHNGIYSFDFSVVCGAGGTTALVTVQYTTAQPPGLVPQLHLGGGVFVSMSGPSPYTYTITGLTACDFSFQFYMAWMAGGLYQSPVPHTPDNTVLPIELIRFDVEGNTDGSVKLNWDTATERNSDYFLIERTTDGQIWEYVDEEKAAGNSSSIIHYGHTDFAPRYSLNGMTYYRLKMVDFDGSFEYSSIRVLKRAEGDQLELSVFPNPTTGEVTIDFFHVNWSLGSLTLHVYNPQGKQVYTQRYNQSKKGHIDFQNLSSSIYLFQFLQQGSLLYQVKVAKN